MLHALSSGARLSVFYAACFFWGGATMVFWPLFLERRGLDKSEVGTVLGVSIWIRAFATPWFASIADSRDARRAALRALSAASLVLAFSFFWVQGFWPVLVAWIAFSVCAAQLSPLCDSLALLLQKRGEMQYGRMRVWGSISFLVVTLVAGAWLQGRDVQNVLWLVVAGMLATVLASLWLPDVTTGRASRALGSRRPLWIEVLAIPGFTPCVFALGCLQSSHATYYAYSAIHWQAVGLSRETIAVLWSLGVLAEIVLFRHGDAVKRRIGLHGLMLVAVLGALVRWTLTASCTSPWLLAPLQVLHAATFGATQICAIGIFQRIVPPHLVSTAQSLYVAVPFGLMMGSSMQLAGWLYERTPSGAFLAMAALSAFAALGLPRLWRLA